MHEPYTRRRFLKDSSMAAFATLLPQDNPATSPTPLTAPSRPWEAFAFTKIDYSGWPKPKQEDAGILTYHLTAQEAENLMRYKIDHGIIDNKGVLQNLKDHHDIKPSGFDIWTAKTLVMKPFYHNVTEEFGSYKAWDSPGSNDMTVANVMDKFWRRMSMHVLKDDIEAQCRQAQGIGLGLILGKSYPLYAKMLGPAEQWRGHVPFDPARVSYKDDATMENIARRMPMLDLPKIMHNLGVSDDIFIVSAEDLRGAGINIDKKKQQAASWTRRVSSPPVNSYRQAP